MLPPFFLGIDGGGTGTRARIRDCRAQLLGEGTAGPANIYLDYQQAVRSVWAAAFAALEAAGLKKDDMGRTYAGLGIAGAGPRETRESLRECFDAFAGTAVGTDAYAAWMGAHDGEDGAVVVLGTGSCGLGRSAGRWHFLGGWGAEVSDDAGGHWIGREAVRRTLWAFDGIISGTQLSEAMLCRFENTPQAIAAFARSARPSDYAALAPMVLEHARQGDPIALAVAKQAASHAARMAERLIEGGAPAVSLTGGLARGLEPWLPLKTAKSLQPPRNDALEGAVMMARRCASVCVN